MPKGTSDYNIVWEEPPAASRGGTSGALFAALEAIQSKPGEWARIVHSNSRSGASSILTGIKKQKRKVPAGKYEYTVRTNGDDNTSSLYARYVGDE